MLFEEVIAVADPTEGGGGAQFTSMLYVDFSVVDNVINMETVNNSNKTQMAYTKSELCNVSTAI